MRDELLKYEQEGVTGADEKLYASSFVAAGMIGILMSWFENGQRSDTEDLARLVCRITNSDPEN